MGPKYAARADRSPAQIISALACVALVLFPAVRRQPHALPDDDFDLAVTVALGSALATILLSKDVAPGEGALAFALLIGLQLVVTGSSVRFPWVPRTVTGEPRVLHYRGEFLDDALRTARVTADEVRAAATLRPWRTSSDARGVLT